MKPVAMVLAAILTMAALAGACTPMRGQDDGGTSVNSPYKRHNDWARYGRPDVGGARANDR